MKLRGSERLSLAAISILILLAFVGHSRQGLLVAPVLVGAGAATILLARLGPRSRLWGLARDFFPALLIVLVFSVLEPVIAGVNPERFDHLFESVDARFFPRLVVAWRGFLNRPALLTDAVYLAYASYYAFPVVVGAAVRLARTPADYEELAFTILASFYACYAGYFLFPTSGPRVPQEAEAALLGGGPASEAVRAFLRVGEGNHLDAFPSGHTGVSLVTLAVGWRLLRSWRPWLVAWAVAIVFATVYIHVHYVIDVAAGAGVGLGAYLVATAALRRADRAAAPGSLAAPE